MNGTLLIDLDDTLLINPLESFMPAYIKLLSKKLSSHIAPEKMVPQLLAATDRMISAACPEKTLEQIFDEHFYPILGLQKAEIEPLINDFYENEFNELQPVTRLRPEAIKLIDFAASRNYTIVVATNPLFPQTAMRSRLRWAGFSETDVPFKFVTSYEIMHFAKPNPAYYAEILGRLGWPHGPICMVGNSLKEDILPSSSLGIPGYWVDGDKNKLPDVQKDLCKVGSLEGVIPWIEGLKDSDDQIGVKEPQGILGTLFSTPAILQYLTADLDDAGWKNKSSTEDLSILELVSHLLDVEKEINQPRLELVLKNENPFVSGVDSDPWIIERHYQTSRSPEVVAEFFIQRQKSTDLLTRLSASDWMRPAQHSFFGPTTLLELVRFIGMHDIDHIRQIYRLLGK